jgi:hypothetical protein
MLIIAISETNLMDSLSVGVYNSTGTDITKSLKFFNIAPASIGWTPNMHSGYIITFDKLSQILFFIFLALLFYCLTDNEISKKQQDIKKLNLFLPMYNNISWIYTPVFCCANEFECFGCISG